MTPADCYVELKDSDSQADNPKQSIVQMVYVEEMLQLYKQIRSRTTLRLPTPPAHITLYTKGSPSGIALESADDLKANYVKRL